MSVRRRITLGIKKVMLEAIYRLHSAPGPRLREVRLSPGALSSAQVIRGPHRPAIIIHGVAQRSGTVFTGELLRLHPDVCAYPRDIFEVPFLRLAKRVRQLQKEFLAAYPPNREGFANDDFLPLFGAAFIGHINAAVPEGQGALLKVPDVRYLAYFSYVFPFEIPVLLMRDGRDVAESTVRTWPEIPFIAACLRWKRNARIMLEQERAHAREGWQIFRYEDAVMQPHEFLERLCRYCRLDVGRYPFERLGEIRLRGSSQFKHEENVSWDPLEIPPEFKPVGRWQNWTARQKRTFKRTCGQTLIDTGYVTNGNW